MSPETQVRDDRFGHDAATVASGPRAESTLSAFLRGLTDPSLHAALVMVATASCLLLLPAFVVTPELMRSRGVEYFAEDGTDFDTFASVRALELQQYRGQAPIIVITGGSTTRDSLVGEYLKEGLATRGAAHVEVFKLTSNRQSLLRSIAMLDSAPPAAHGVALIGVQPGIFTAGLEEIDEEAKLGRYAVRSKAFDDELAALSIRPARRFGVFFFDNLTFFLARTGAVWNHVRGNKTVGYTERMSGMDTPVNERRWRQIGTRVSAGFARYDEYAHFGFAALDRVVRRLQTTSRLTPVLVEAPINPRFVDEFGQGPLLDRHRTRMRAFASGLGVRYVILNDEIAMSSESFYDWAHLNDEPTVRRCADLVVNLIAEDLLE